MAVIQGTITEQGAPVEARTVRVHNRFTGDLLDEDTTSVTGAYSLDTGAVPISDVFVIALPIQEELEVPSYNAAATLIS